MMSGCHSSHHSRSSKCPWSGQVRQAVLGRIQSEVSGGRGCTVPVYRLTESGKDFTVGREVLPLSLVYAFAGMQQNIVC